MFAINIISLVNLAFVLIWDEDVVACENDLYTKSICGTVADGLTAAVLERKHCDAALVEQYPDLRTIVRALRCVERGGNTADLDSDASRAVLAVGVWANIDAAVRVEDELNAAALEAATSGPLI